MNILPCNKEIYTGALINYYSRLNNYEKGFKGKTRELFLNNYLKNTVYTLPPINYEQIRAKLRINIYLIFNNIIEYNFPHTLDNIIIMPAQEYDEKDFYSIINHELIHIMFKYFTSNLVKNFMDRTNMVRINRSIMPKEITNPDTSYFTGLKYNNKIIFIALVHNITTYTKSYYTTSSTTSSITSSTTSSTTSFAGSTGSICKSTNEEIAYYDKHLPYLQNYHPEEILAELYVLNYDKFITFF